MKNLMKEKFMNNREKYAEIAKRRMQDLQKNFFEGQISAENPSYHRLAQNVTRVHKICTYVWGNNTNGTLGLACNSEERMFVPIPEKLPIGFVKVRTGNKHSIAIDQHGILHTWGDNKFG